MLRILLSCGLLLSGGDLAARDIEAVLDWQQRVELGTLLDGMVNKVNVEVGQRVSRGTLLIELDQRENQAQLAWAEAQVAVARLQQDEARRELDRSLELYDRTLLSNHERIVDELAPTTPLPELIGHCTAMLEPLEERIARETDPTAQRWFADLSAALERGSGELRGLRHRLLDNAARAEAAAFAMDFALLYDADARLFRIGYNVSNDRIDPHYYDLLATEARLASYFAIAKRGVPTEHWFYLRRPTTRANGELSLLSWNGSMFEYLMPALFLRSASDKLLGESERAAVSIQRRYGDGLSLPWGISESAFASRDAEHRYQYRAFGVPGLGLRRGLARDVVVAPYASALALAVAPLAAVRNLERLAELGAEGLYGFVEALDFTPERVAAGRSFTAIQAHMAHHQGMIMTAVGNVLTDDALVRRFDADMRVRSASLLLQERIPWELPPVAVSTEEPAEMPARRRTIAPAPVTWTPHGGPTVPKIHLLASS